MAEYIRQRGGCEEAEEQVSVRMPSDEQPGEAAEDQQRDRSHRLDLGRHRHQASPLPHNFGSSRNQNSSARRRQSRENLQGFEEIQRHASSNLIRLYATSPIASSFSSSEGSEKGCLAGFPTSGGQPVRGGVVPDRELEPKIAPQRDQCGEGLVIAVDPGREREAANHEDEHGVGRPPHRVSRRRNPASATIDRRPARKTTGLSSDPTPKTNPATRAGRVSRPSRVVQFDEGQEQGGEGERDDRHLPITPDLQPDRERRERRQARGDDPGPPRQPGPVRDGRGGGRRRSPWRWLR